MSTNEKFCLKCNTIKSVSDFSKKTDRTRSSDGLQSACKICNRLQAKDYRARNKSRTEIIIPEFKSCSKCLITQPSSSFASHRSRMSGISSTCKKCDSARLKLKGEQNSARTVIEIPDRKFCSDCKEILSESRFSRAIRKNDGLHSICKECVKSRNLSNKVKVLNAIGGAICVKCHITEPEFLTVQHKLGGGNLHRRKIGWNKIYANILNDPDTTKYEVLCANCNLEESITRIVSSNSPILRKIKERRKELKRLAYQILCNGSINCACCKSVPNLNKLSIDHIVPYSIDNEGPRDTMTLYRWIISDNKSPEEQSRIRSKFQILCANCNMSKGSSGICIHKRIAFL